MRIAPQNCRMKKARDVSYGQETFASREDQNNTRLSCHHLVLSLVGPIFLSFSIKSQAYLFIPKEMVRERKIVDENIVLKTSIVTGTHFLIFLYLYHPLSWDFTGKTQAIQEKDE